VFSIEELGIWKTSKKNNLKTIVLKKNQNKTFNSLRKKKRAIFSRKFKRFSIITVIMISFLIDCACRNHKQQVLSNQST
tara:strand:+ start:2767 stop:3003 length:237 start_codon:yes stop_codon:yes gene_type:complete